VICRVVEFDHVDDRLRRLSLCDSLYRLHDTNRALSYRISSSWFNISVLTVANYSISRVYGGIINISIILKENRYFVPWRNLGFIVNVYDLN